METAVTPCIIRENSSGFLRLSLQDEMLEHREIGCVGEISQGLVHSLILQLRYLQRTDPDAEITMYVNSNGGLVSEGLALYDVMQSVTAPVRTVCIGAAASMAALLFLSGTKGRREILPHSRIMIHDPLVSGGLSGSATAVNEKAKQLMETREATAKIIAEHTGHAIEEVYGKTATDSWFDAESAIRWGMADRVIRRI